MRTSSSSAVAIAVRSALSCSARSDASSWRGANGRFSSRGEHLDRVLLAHDGTDAARTAVRLVGSWPIFSHAAVQMFSVAYTAPGPATTQILTAAALAESDLIVLGSAAAHGLDRVLHGDLADDLVLHARCSLLIVPADARVDLRNPEPSLTV